MQVNDHINHSIGQCNGCSHLLQLLAVSPYVMLETSLLNSFFFLRFEALANIIELVDKHVYFKLIPGNHII